MSQELKPYRVTIAHDACTTHDVQATDKHDAMVKAHDEASVTLCHQCSNEIEMGDPLRALSVEDLTTGETDDEIEPHWEVASLRARVAALEAEIARTHQPAQVVPEGFVLVPVVPTNKMLRAAFEACKITHKGTGFATANEARRATYSAMLAASQQGKSPV